METYATGAVLLLGLALAVYLAEAKTKVYDHTGQLIVIAFPSDYHFSSTVDGNTYTTDCNVTDGGATCTDKSVFFSVILEDGSETAFDPRQRLDLDPAHRFDPLAETMIKNLKVEFDSKNHVLYTFDYRIEPKPKLPPGQYLFPGGAGVVVCIPYTQTRIKSGKRSEREACYLFDPVKTAVKR
jgi:hypothetical protein